jgi:phosphatidylglycerol:prolipoprotein diacylglycerol transferase
VLALILIPLFWKSGARWRPGLLSGIFVGGYGVARFCVEYFREPDRQLEDLPMPPACRWGSGSACR